MKRISINVYGEVKEKPIGDLSLDLPAEFPKKWFDDNEGKKPKLSIPRARPGNHGGVDARMGELWAQQTNFKVAMEFVYNYIAEKCKIRLTEDWTSYGVTIGASGREICPFDICEVVRDDYDLGQNVGAPIEEKDKWGRVIEILGIYRANSAPPEYPEYRTAMINRMALIASKAPFFAQNFDPVTMVSVLSWGSEETLKKMAACVDMFFNKFRDTPFAGIRITTLPSRDKDCGGLNALQDLTDYLGKPTIESIPYLMDPGVGKELDRLLEEYEEIVQGDSYFHYMRDLGLSQKSPYSSKANPRIYNLVYAIGVFVGNKRATNAKLFKHIQLQNTINIAAYVAYCTRKWVSAAYVAGSADDVKAVKALMDAEEGDQQSAMSVFEMIKENNNEMSQEVRDYFEHTIRSIVARPGTIGEHIKAYFM